MPRRARPKSGGQKGKKRGAQRRAKAQMRRKGYERVSPSYMKGGRGRRQWKRAATGKEG
jgi:hypothetical protein